jgi:nucleoside phosphorylase
MPTHQQPRDRDGFEIAILCALRIEANAVEAMFDEFWDETDDISYWKAVGEPNGYTLGRIGRHNVVLAYMPGMGKSTSASVAASVRASFNSIRLCLVVGICGGVPTGTNGEEILLGDVVISTGIVQFDFGRQHPQGVEVKDALEGNLSNPSPEIRAFLRRIEAGRSHSRLTENTAASLTELCNKDKFRTSQYPGANHDVLYPPTYRHMHRKQGSCSVCTGSGGADVVFCKAARTASCSELECDDARQVRRARLENIKSSIASGETSLTHRPEIHLGLVASGDLVMRSANHRDTIAARNKVIAFEMEGAGVWDNFTTVVIKGVCDYADSHKNKTWQRYAAASAAACMKSFLMEWRGVERTSQNKSSSKQLSEIDSEYNMNAMGI